MGLTDYIVMLIYGLCFVVALLAIIHRIEWSLLLLVFVLPLQNLLQRLQAYPMGKDFANILVGAMLVGWFLSSARREGGAFEKKLLDGVILLYIIWTFVGLWVGSLNLGEDLPISLDNERFKDWKNLVLLPLLYLITVNNVKDRKWMNFVIVLGVASVFFVDVFFYKEYRWYEHWHYSHDQRIGGPFTYLGPNELGAFFVQYGMVIFGLFLFEERRLRKIWFGGIWAFSTYCLAYSFSRAGYMALVIGMMFLTFLKSKKLFVLCLAVFALLWFSPENYPVHLPVSVRERIEMTYSEDWKSDAKGDSNGLLDPSAEGRFGLWSEAMDRFWSNPIIGSGFRTFSRAGGADTHNNYLKMLSELGILGFGIYLLLYFLAFKSGWDLYKKSSEGYLKGLGIGFAGCVLANMVVNLTHDNWSYMNLMGLYWILLGVVQRSKLIAEQERVPSPSTPHGRF